MKIKNFDIFVIKENKRLLNHKFPQPTFFKKGFIFFKINTCSDISGLGEPNPYAGSKTEIHYILSKILLPLIKGKNINKLDLNRIRDLVSKKIVNTTGFSSCLVAVANAIGEIKAKAEKKSFSQIIKQKVTNSSISLYASGGMIFENQKYESLIEEALMFKEQKFIGWKFRPKSPIKYLSHRSRSKNPPPFNLKEFISFTKKLRLAVGNNFKLMVDFGSRCSNIRETIYILDFLKEIDFFFIEEPLKTNLRDYIKLKNLKKKYPIATGEFFYDFKKIDKWINSKAVNTYQFDTNMIEYSMLFKLSKKIKNLGFNLIPHNWYNLINNNTNVSFLNSAVTKNKIIEYNILKNPFKDIFINNMYKIKDGKIVLKNHSGLGIKLNNKIIKKFI